MTEFAVAPFWGERSCPTHAHDGTRACCGCARLQPVGEAWAELADGRRTCLACLQSIVTDTADAQPLYSQARGPPARGRQLCLCSPPCCARRACQESMEHAVLRPAWCPAHEGAQGS